MSLVPADWRVRVFGPSVLVDILSDRLTVCTFILFLFLSAFTYAPVTSPFIIKHKFPFGRTSLDISIN